MGIPNLVEGAREGVDVSKRVLELAEIALSNTLQPFLSQSLCIESI
jgi:hypothetical protein